MHRLITTPTILCLTLVTSALPLIASELPAPETVSPGDETSVEVDTTCPTFSWGGVEGAAVFELVVFRISSSGSADPEPVPVLKETLPGTVTTWTPPGSRCFSPSLSYGWTVRALEAEDPAQEATGILSPWASVRLFSVPALASDGELREALELLRSLAAEKTATGTATRRPSARRELSVTEADPELTSRSTAAAAPDATAISGHLGAAPGVLFGVHGKIDGTGTGSAGVVGQATATSGDVHGVVGVTASEQGAGGVFENTAGGDILRGLNASSEVFTVSPTGVVSAASFVGDGSGLSSVEWNQLQSVPTGFADGVDDDTLYQAGPGLSLSGTTLGIASLPLPGFTNHAIDSSNAQFPAIVIGLDGLPLISYFDAVNGDLKVAHCEDMVCSSATTTTLDSTGLVGLHSSITIGRHGYGLISYYDQTNGNLKLASCGNTACTSASLSTVDSTGDVGQYTGITTTDVGYAFIAYYDADGRDLKAVKCNNLTCSSNTIWVVDAVGDVGQYASVTRNFNDYGYISYYDATNGNLKVARCVSMSCATSVINIVDGTGTTGGAEDDVGRYSSVATAADGMPVIAYAKAYQAGVSGSQVRVAHCATSTCSTAQVDSMISASSINWQGISISRGRDALPVITAAFDTTSRVYVFHCSDPGCSSQTISDSTVTSGAVSASITIGADGLPILVYHTDTDFALRVVHCSDVSCQPYLRER